MRIISPDQLPVNPDGTIFHLHLLPEQLSDKVIVMGDPERVGVVARRFDSIEFDSQSREFRTITGSYNGKRITALSHGIGCDNLDIVMTELDALANIDLKTRQVKDKLKALTIVRIGTSGGLQPFAPIGSYVASQLSMGMDGLLYFYEGNDQVILPELADRFIEHTGWNKQLARPYFIDSDAELLEQITFDMIKGITISASGFYGPQGRHVRLGLSHPNQHEKIESFAYNSLKITNYEMESAALAGMAKLMGHKALTICLIIAGRYSGTMNTDYKRSFDDLITRVLDRI